MNNICVLDDATINKIAAGEVVERPVSVVKELVENAIDAGAKSISVEIKDGGVSLIRVTDNGNGIVRGDIRTAFLRHATSKITCAEDLTLVTSLGFRGEALSSICAVSKVELLTKTKDDFCGVRYVINGGREHSFDDAGVPEGTTIIVCDLFFNTPARRKFLKSYMTEANYVTELMEKLILSHPDVSFKYIVNGKEKLISYGKSSPLENIYEIFGRDTAKLMIPVDCDFPEVKITGFIGKPEIARGNRNFELFFVNGRCVKSNMLSKAVEESYSNFLMLHKYPFVVLYFDIPGQNLDVNVHPAKTEVRFYNEEALSSIIANSITEALNRKEMIPEVTAEKAYVKTEINIKPDANIKPNANIKADTDLTLVSAPKKSTEYSPEPFERVRIEEVKTEQRKEAATFDVIKNVEQQTLFNETFLSENNVIRHKIIGQLFNTYWIVECDDKMYIIDQHAAHEKVLYERIKKRIENDDIYSQHLIPSIVISLTNSEMECFFKFADSFKELGFEIEHFGGNDFAISAVPVDLFGLNEKEYFLSILDDLMENKRVKSPVEIKDQIATMACKAAIKGNMSFSISEGKALIDELLKLDNPYNCPHGRPTIISYSIIEIEKLFKRIV